MEEKEIKINLRLYIWRWAHISTEKAKEIITQHSTLINHILNSYTYQDYTSILWDIEELKHNTTKVTYNDENGKRFLTLARC